MDITGPVRGLLDVTTRHLPGGLRKHVNTSVALVGTSVEFADTCRLQVKCYCLGQLNWSIFKLLSLLFFTMAPSPSGPGTPHYRGFIITLRHITIGRTPVDEWSARSWDLYLTTHNTHNRETSMSAAGFEPTIPESEQPQTRALYRMVTGIGS